FISVLSTQAPSQSTSVGQARAQLPPKIFASRIVFAAPGGFLCRICRMNFGMSMCVGQARGQGASNQKRHGLASTSASSAARGGGKSAKCFCNVSKLNRSPALAIACYLINGPRMTRIKRIHADLNSESAQIRSIRVIRGPFQTIYLSDPAFSRASHL